MSQGLTAQVNAPAKLNLNLHITGRLENGYHTIDSVVQAIALHDTISFVSRPMSRGAYDRLDLRPEQTVVELMEFSLGDQGSLPIVLHYEEESIPEASTGAPADNLLVKAWQLALRDRGLPLVERLLGTSGIYPDLLLIELHLDKQIPSGAGMGGGSADAAALLRVLYEDCGFTQAQLDQLAYQLGADVPGLIRGGTIRCRGIGEKVEVIQGELPTWHYLLVKPAFAIATPEAYAAVDRQGILSSQVEQERFIEAIRTSDRVGLQEAGGNEFLRAMSERPELKTWIQRLRATQPLFADLTGSGATLFAAYASEAEAQAAQEQLKEHIAREKVWSTLTYGLPDAYNLSII